MAGTLPDLGQEMPFLLIIEVRSEPILLRTQNDLTPDDELVGTYGDEQREEFKHQGIMLSIEGLGFGDLSPDLFQFIELGFDGVEITGNLDDLFLS
jgi:hypothetical protein